MTLADYLLVVRKQWVLILLFPLVGVLLTAGWSLHATPLYTSTASMYFSLSYGDSAVDLSQGSSYTTAQMESYSILTTSPTVLEKVKDALPFEGTVQQLADSVTSTISAGTVIIQIHATDPIPERAKVIADQVAVSLSGTVRQLSPKNAKGTPTVDVTMIGDATVPTKPSSPATKRNLAAGLLGGLILGICVAALRDRLDTRIRSQADIAQVVQAPLLGEIGSQGSSARKVVAVRDLPLGVSAERFRQLRTNLQFLRVDERPLAVVVTSSHAGEEKSVTAINLAFACAEAGERVLLVDADLRRPAVADYLRLEAGAGLSTLLAGRATFDEVLQPVGESGRLEVLTAGATPPNPSELLSSQGMHDLLATVRTQYDLILLDSSPLLPFTEAAVLSKLTSGAILVAGAGKVRRGDLGDSVHALEQIDARLLGVVLTRSRRREKSTYGGRHSGLRKGRPSMYRGRPFWSFNEQVEPGRGSTVVISHAVGATE